jgi:hypothetical protein
MRPQRADEIEPGISQRASNIVQSRSSKVEVLVDGAGRAMKDAIATQFDIANAVDLNWRHEN